MMKAGFGRIVFMSSVSGVRGIPGHTVYAASKAGLDGLARTLARECAAFGVTVNSVAPGYIDTRMLDGMTADRKKALAASVPVRRLGTPEEVAHLVAFLLSEQAAYATGQTWVLDGGLSS
jgi:3-oxoacyl-[acyl-carrier protein] reductase